MGSHNSTGPATPWGSLQPVAAAEVCPLVPFTPRPTQRCRQPGKRGLKQALAAARVSQATALGFADEMRVGLRVKVYPRLQLADPWRYRFLVVNAQVGQLHWCWLASMAGAPMGRQWVD
jgi:hypothetical protein